MRKEFPEFGRELGKMLVDVADGACEELVKSDIFPDKKTCVISLLKR